MRITIIYSTINSSKHKITVFDKYVIGENFSTMTSIKNRLKCIIVSKI